jgi:hypothetical protein
MIVYNLLCDNAHRFEGWFASPEAFAHQHDAGQLACPVCGSADVSKQPSAPHVQTRARAPVAEEAVMAKPEMLGEIRKRVMEYILENSEDVGTRFPQEARAIVRNEAPERAIRGKATAREAQELRDEGIEVFTIPALPVPPGQLH